MSQLLEIQPSNQLKFIFEVMKQSTCNVRLINKTDQHVAFKVKTTSPKKYCVQPNVGVVLPKETFDFVVIMQSQRTPPTDLVCKDKFLVQSTIVTAGTVQDDVTSYMFSKDDGKYIEERKLKVILVSPPHSPELSPMHPKFKLVPPVEDPIVDDGMFSRTERYSSHHLDVEHANEIKIANKEVEKPVADVKPEAVKSTDSELTEAAKSVTMRDVEHAKELKVANKGVEKSIADVKPETEKSVESELTKAAKPIKAVESDSENKLEARPVKETKPTVISDAMDLRSVKDVELTKEAEPMNKMDVESPPIEVMESNPMTKLEATSVGGIEPRMIKDAKDLRSINDVELAKEEPAAVKDVESPPIKFVESNLLDKLEARQGKETAPTMMKDAKDLGLAKDVELKKEAPVTVKDVECSPIKVVESKSVDKVVATPVKEANPTMKKDVEDLSLAKDVEVLKSKLLELESKFGQAEKNISKLVEERRSTTQEREFIQQELALLRAHRVQKAVHEGFPPLFLWLVAVISIVIGYRLHP